MEGGRAHLPRRWECRVERHLIGNFVPGSRWQGCSITLVKLDDEMVRYWDAPVNTPGLRWGV